MKLNLKSKLFASIGIPILVVIIVILVILQSGLSRTASMLEHIYSISNVSISKLLNADRDYYQALVAEQNMLSLSPDTEEYASEKESYIENANQVLERAMATKDIIDQSTFSKELTHDESNKTFEQLFIDFESNYAQWKEKTDEKLEAYEKTGKIINVNNMEYFDITRNSLDQIGELINKVSNQEMASYLNQTKNYNYSIYSVLIIFLFVGLVCAYFIGRQISNPLVMVTELAKKMAKGNFNEEIPNKLFKNKDEVGELVRAFNTMIENIRELIKSIVNSTEQVSMTSENMKKISQQSSQSSNEIAQTIEEIARGASDQAQNTQEGSSQIALLGEFIIKDQDYVSELNQSLDKVINSKDESLEAVKILTSKTEESDIAIKNIYEGIIKTNESSERINKASSVIASISEQTNLLALNAAIEAARAGDAGHGFAVVADEIRKLAEQSMVSTEEIDSVVNELQHNSKNAVETMENVSEVIKQQVQSVKITEEKNEEIAKAIEDVGEIIKKLNISGNEMEKMKTEIVDVMQNLSAIAEENAAGTEQAAASTEQQKNNIEDISNETQGLTSLTKELNKAVKQFKI